MVPGSPDPYTALAADEGLRAILESSVYGESVTGTAIVDTQGTVVASGDLVTVGRQVRERADLAALLEKPALAQLRAIYSSEGQTLDVRQPITLNGEAFGSVRIGVSTLLMGQELSALMRPAVLTAAVALAISVLVAGLLAQLLLRPIHVIRRGLTRLGRGEFGVTLDLPPGDEFGERGSFFNTVSRQLSADRTLLAGQEATVRSTGEHVADAVALFNSAGDLLFSNLAMQATLPTDAIGRAVRLVLPAGHPYRTMVEETLETRKSRGPVHAHLDGAEAENVRAAGASIDAPAADGVMLMTHAIEEPDQGLVGVLLVARNLVYLSTMQSTLAYSRKLVALGRLTAGIAHEVKNPLNAMTIHLKLLRAKIGGAALAAEPAAVAAGVDAGRGRTERGGLGLASAARPPALPPQAQGALDHVQIIEREIRRLDEVVQGLLKFTRPEDLSLGPVDLPTLFQEILPVIDPEARKVGVKVIVDAPASLPGINGDAGMLRQALLNLAINGCQAMPSGGTLRLVAAPTSRDTTEVRVEDTGVGIPPEHLGKIFDLYLTTKDHGTGIGLSMVYRIVQMHDGEIEVQSTPGHGTTFRILLPRGRNR